MAAHSLSRYSFHLKQQYYQREESRDRQEQQFDTKIPYMYRMFRKQKNASLTKKRWMQPCFLLAGEKGLRANRNKLRTSTSLAAETRRQRRVSSSVAVPWDTYQEVNFLIYRNQCWGSEKFWYGSGSNSGSDSLLQ